MTVSSPVIFSLGSLQLRWYGLFAALAALLFYALMACRAKRRGMDAGKIADLMVLIIISGLVGARLEYVRRFWSEFFAADWPGIFRVWEGGLVFQGGFIFAAVACLIFCRYRKYPCGGVADLIALALPAAHAVARVGCFLNGCCFGRPWNGWGGVTYAAAETAVARIQQLQGLLPTSAVLPLPAFPVQLLEALCCALIALVIWWMERRRCCDNRRFFVYLILYCIVRFLVEFLRGDYCPVPQWLTPAQVTTLFVVLPAALLALAAVHCWTKRVPIARRNMHTS